MKADDKLLHVAPRVAVLDEARDVIDSAALCIRPSSILLGRAWAWALRART